VPEVFFDRALIKIGQRAATACDPTQEPADHIETSPNAMANQAVPHETRRVALDKLTVRPAPETPEQLASVQVIVAFHLPGLRY
jgi:hypothetical protein